MILLLEIITSCFSQLGFTPILSKKSIASTTFSSSYFSFKKFISLKMSNIKFNLLSFLYKIIILSENFAIIFPVFISKLKLTFISFFLP